METLSEIAEFLVSLPAVIIYKKANQELEQTCNFAPEMIKNKDALNNSKLPMK